MGESRLCKNVNHSQSVNKILWKHFLANVVLSVLLEYIELSVFNFSQTELKKMRIKNKIDHIYNLKHADCDLRTCL
jgi:hypothetical protein